MAKNEIEILVTAEVDKAIKNIEKVKGKTQKSGKGMLQTLGKLKAGWIAVAGVLTGTVAVALKKVITVASDAEEEFAKFGEVFKGVGKEAEQVAKTLQKSMGLSELSVKRLLASSGDLLQGFGFTRKESLDLSKDMVKLAGDVASFKNVQGGTAEVLKAFNSALVGERERLKTLGIAILETDIKQRALEKGIKLVNGQVDRQNKSLITAELIFEKSKNSVGDLERTWGSFANTSRRVQERITDLQVFIGSKLLPIATLLLNKFGDLIEPIDDIAQKIIDLNNKFRVSQKIIAVYVFWFKTLANVLKVSVLNPLRVAIGLFNLYRKTLFDLLSPIIEVIKRIGELGDKVGLIGGITRRIKTFATAVKSTLTPAIDGVVTGISKLIKPIKDVIEFLFGASQVISSFVVPVFDKVIGKLSKIVDPIVKVVTKAKDGIKKLLGDDVVKSFDSFGDGVVKNAKKFGEGIIAPIKETEENFLRLLGALRRKNKKTQDDVTTDSNDASVRRKEALEAEKVEREKLIKQAVRMGIAETELTNLTNAQIQSRINGFEKEKEVRELLIKSGFDLAKSASDLLFEIEKQNREKSLENANEFTAQLAELDEQEKQNKKLKLEEELADAQKAGDTQLANEKALQLKRIDLQEKQAEKERELKNKGAKAQRDADIAKAGVNTALAVGNALATVQPFIPNGLIASGLALAKGTAELVAVSNAPLPQFASGGISDGGLAMVGERGAELVNLPKGARVFNNNESKSIANSFSVGNVTLPGVQNGEQFYQELQQIQRQYGSIQFGG